MCVCFREHWQFGVALHVSDHLQVQGTWSVKKKTLNFIHESNSSYIFRHILCMCRFEDVYSGRSVSDRIRSHSPAVSG